MNKPDSSSLALNTLNELQRWWNNYKEVFVKGGIATKIIFNKEEVPLLQRFYVHEPQLKDGSSFNKESIPFLEITSLYRVAKNGLLFVNCNPSGTDYSFYGKKNPYSSEVFYYYNDKNDYFKAVKLFSERVYEEGFTNYAMIDVFPLVMQNQAVLKKAYITAITGSDGGLKDAFKSLINIFIGIIEQIQPKVIIVTNAFVKELFRNNPEENKRKKQDIRMEGITVSSMDENYVCYHVTTRNGFQTTVFCGGMIAGGHQMDTESKERLIREVRRFLGFTPTNRSL